MKKLINIILLFILLVMSIMNCFLANRLADRTEELIELTDLENEVIIVDSIEYDTVYITKTVVVRLPIYNTDTILTTDTILVTDSVDVVIPINTYHYDTTLNKTHINLICEGFDVRLNTLLVERINVAQKQEKAPKKWYDNFEVGVGLGITHIDRVKIVPMLGVYYNLFSF